MPIDEDRMDRFTWQEGDVTITKKEDTPATRVDPKRNWIDPDDKKIISGNSDEVTDLLLEIARCDNIHGNNSHCQTIIQTQSADDFQLPEPWSGDLENAPILFLSSNPSIGMKEKYPISSWTDEQIIDFFSNRFGGGLEEWTSNGRHTLLNDGSFKKTWVRYWGAARGRAAELLGRRNVKPGIDYAFSEVVHCKSHDEHGVGCAFDECTGRYLNSLIACSGAKIIVCFGQFAEKAVRDIFNIQNSGHMSEPVKIGNTHLSL